MHVALVHMRHADVGGTERYQNHLARHLAALGDRVTIVCRTHAEPPHPDVRFAELKGLALGGAWRMWSFAQAVEKHVRAANYDVVYGLGKTWTHDAIRLGGGCHRTYLDLVADTSEGVRLKDKLALKIEARALAKDAYRAIVTNSAMVKRDVIQRHGVPPEKVRVIHNGVDLERFHPRRKRDEGAKLRTELGLSSEARVLLFLGTGYARKGLDLVLDAFTEVVAKQPETRLVVVGRDSTPGSWRSLADGLGIADKVRFLGERRDAQACFAAADVYALPTRYDPFANSTLEALATGVPTVTSETNGAAELLEHRVQGSVLSSELPDESRARALAVELLHWLDRDVARAGGERARALAEQHGHDACAAKSRAVLRELVPSRPEPAERAQ